MLTHIILVEEDLIYQLFNPRDEGMARPLLVLARYGKQDQPDRILVKISQETLAKMIGTTRSRVNFFMNRFRDLGLIEYNGRIRVHKSLLNVVLHDQMPGDNAIKPVGPNVRRKRPGSAKINRIGQK